MSGAFSTDLTAVKKLIGRARMSKKQPIAAECAKVMDEMITEIAFLRYAVTMNDLRSKLEKKDD